MAFMMPVMKKNYNIYGDGTKTRNPSGPEGGGLVRKISQGSANGSMGSSNGGVASRRRVQSEGPSLCTSPKHSQGEVIINRIPIPRNNSATGGHPPVSASRSVPMRRGRGSTPAFGNVPSPFVRHNSLPEGPNSVPTHLVPVSPTHSTGSTSSDSSTEGHPPHHRFHIKLLNRLKKSFRSKDPAPAAS